MKHDDLWITKRESWFVVIPRSAPIVSAVDAPMTSRTHDLIIAVDAIKEQPDKWRIVQLETSHNVRVVDEVAS